MNPLPRLVPASLLALGLMLSVAPATAAGNDAVVRGGCSGATTWKVKANPDNGRIEVEGEIDSNHPGQTWRWRLVHDGSVSARGRATTVAPSGSFEVRRTVVDMAGPDRLVFRATNPRTGEVCRGRVAT